MPLRLKESVRRNRGPSRSIMIARLQEHDHRPGDPQTNLVFPQHAIDKRVDFPIPSLRRDQMARNLDRL